MNSLKQLLFVHFRSFFREPAILFWAVLFPILMAWVLGVAFTNKGETLSTVYVISNQNNPKLGYIATGEKELVTGEDIKSPYRIKIKQATEKEAITALKKGEISLYLESKSDSIVYHFDPSNPDAKMVHLMLEREFADLTPRNAFASKSKVEPLTTKGTRYIDFLIPGLIALGIMNSCLWGISWNLIESRMKKLLRRLIATPMIKSYFFVSHVITRIVLATFETVLLLLFAYLYFQTEITGSFAAFILVFLAGIFAFCGIGILAGSRTSNSQVGNGIINAVTIPMMILSGIFFNYHNFPEWTLPFIQALPLTMLADSIRAVFIEGAGVNEVLFPILVLTGFGLLTFVAGLKIFKWY